MTQSYIGASYNEEDSGDAHVGSSHFQKHC